MLKTGKLDSDLLEKIVFGNLKFKRPEVLTRPGIGEDCAVIDFSPYECVISTDPITAAINDIGRLAVHISCNDIASNGIEPLGIVLAVMLPPGTTEEQVSELVRQAGQAAEELGVEIIGGHTEITPAVSQPVIVSTAVGRGAKGASQTGSDMKPGDYILMSKTAGLEGTGILACDFEKQLKKVLTAAELQKAKGLLRQVSVVKEGVAAGKVGTHGMHDVTEGGVLGALWELCRISGTGAELWTDQVSVEPVTRKICDCFSLNYLRLISSGCMMIIVAPEKKEEMKRAMEEAGAPACYIGVIREPSRGIRMNVNGGTVEIEPPASDELYKVIGK